MALAGSGWRAFRRESIGLALAIVPQSHIIDIPVLHRLLSILPVGFYRRAFFNLKADGTEIGCGVLLSNLASRL